MPDTSTLQLKSDDTKKIDIKSLHGYAINPSLSLINTNRLLMLVAESVTFGAGHEPVSVGVVYPDINGAGHYLPDLRVGTEGDGLAPAVQFLKDEQGNVSLRLQLVFKKPLQGADAASLLIPQVDQAEIAWNGGTFALPKPSYYAEAGEQGYRFLASVPAAIVTPLVAAMKNMGAGTAVKIPMSVKYKVQKSDGAAQPHIMTGVLQPDRLLRAATLRFAPPTPAPAPVARTLMVQPFILAALEPAVKTTSIEKFRINPDLLTGLGRPDAANDSGATEDRSRTMNVAVQMFFSGAADNEKQVYAALEAKKDAHIFDARWQHTDYGIFCPSSFPNSIYMMPHALRLRYNPDTNLPDISPILYKTDNDEIKVRLRFGVMPWYDFGKVTNLRDFLTAANPSAFAYPELITDFACTATLKLSTQFTAEIKLLSETANLRVNFASLLALDLDVSLEFYKLITTMLEGAVGITGMLSIAMKPDDADVPDAEAIDSVEIPFSLKISEIANPQVRFSAPDVSDTDKPMRVVARNTGKHDLTFNTAMPHLLYRDPNAVMPLNVFQARVGQALPLCIAAGQSIELEIQDDPDLKDSVWNSLDMVFSDYSIDIDPKAALQQTYELMPPGDLTWTLTVEVPPLTMTPRPPGMDKIFAVMVEIEVEGRAPITLTLKPDTPRQTFKISPSLKEVMGMDGGVEFLKYVYKTRTVLTDRMLDWTAPAEQQGSSIFIFPAVS